MSKLSKIMISLLSITLIVFTYIIYTQKQDIDNLLQQLEYQQPDQSTEQATNHKSSDTKKLPTVETLSTGNYTVGTDIAPGIYNLKAISGTGVISGDLQEGFLNELMGIMEGYEDYYSETYKNLYLKKGDTFEIQSGVTIKFIPIS